MPVPDDLNDDYVTQLLKKDAERDQNRFLTNSLGGLLTARPRSKDAPRPNTRFLRNIIRETDGHNAALKAKEEAESRDRLRGLKRRREDADESSRDGERVKREKRNEERRSDGGRREEGKRSDYRERDGDDREKPKARSSHTERRRDNDRHGSRRNDTEDRRNRERVRCPTRRRHESDRDRRHYNRRRSPSRRLDSPSPDEDEAEDSDPLDTLIGPKPPPKSLPRGRGAYKDSSATDARFAADYDPAADTHHNSDHDDVNDDWDMALQALRDRAKWRKSGAERMRAAGFSEDDVKRWEGSSGIKESEREKGAEDVRWAKKGEGREWDRGKVNDGGRVDVKASWTKSLD